MEIITRQEYMKDSSHLHRAYYGQFVNENVKARVAAAIGLETLLFSKDEHLNDIPLRRWDALGGFAFSSRTGEMTMKPTTTEPINYILLKEAGEGYSSSTAVCIYKEAARQMIEEEGNK